MKKYNTIPIAALLAFLLVCLTCINSVNASPKIYINGNELTVDVDPYIENGRTLVPLRNIFEALGCNVQWDSSAQKITATKSNTVLQLYIGGQAQKNGQNISLDAPAVVIDGRTMVPLRFVSESLGCSVDWNSDTGLINITSPNATQDNEKTFTYGNGDSYQGYFLADNLKNGTGTYTWVNGITFQGTWVNNGMDNGSLSYSSNDDYNGSFSSNQRNGYGTYKWPNGDSYVGYWKDDMMNGYGKYAFANGDIYEGNWSDNQMNGAGTYTFASGVQLTGTWADNVYQG
jgi:hypothetical protein